MRWPVRPAPGARPRHGEATYATDVDGLDDIFATRTLDVQQRGALMLFRSNP